MEADLQKEILELKAAQAALRRAISKKQRQLTIEQAVIQHEAEALLAEAPVIKLSEGEMEVVVETFKRELSQEETSTHVQ